MLRGIPVSQGVSQGRVVVLNRSRIVPAKAGFETDDQAGEEARFQTALAETRKQLTAVQERLRDEFWRPVRLPEAGRKCGHEI